MGKTTKAVPDLAHVPPAVTSGPEVQDDLTALQDDVGNQAVADQLAEEPQMDPQRKKDWDQVGMGDKYAARHGEGESDNGIGIALFSVGDTQVWYDPDLGGFTSESDIELLPEGWHTPYLEADGTVTMSEGNTTYKATPGSGNSWAFEKVPTPLDEPIPGLVYATVGNDSFLTDQAGNWFEMQPDAQGKGVPVGPSWFETHAQDGTLHYMLDDGTHHAQKAGQRGGWSIEEVKAEDVPLVPSEDGHLSVWIGSEMVLTDMQGNFFLEQYDESGAALAPTPVPESWYDDHRRSDGHLYFQDAKDGWHVQKGSPGSWTVQPVDKDQVAPESGFATWSEGSVPFSPGVNAPEISHDHGHLDDGNGNIDESKREDPTWGDRADRAMWATRLLLAQVAKPSLSDATDAYSNFLNGGGAPQVVDYDSFLNDDASGQTLLESAKADTTNGVVARHQQMLAEGDTATSFSISSGKIGVNDGRYPYPATENWQKAIGAHALWIEAHAVATPKGDGTYAYEVRMTLHAEDMYNFNPGASDMATGTPDSVNGRFEITGLGQEYLNTGTSHRDLQFEQDPTTYDAAGLSRPGSGWDLESSTPRRP